MSETFNVRATSFVASAGLLGLAVLSAFTMTFATHVSDWGDETPIIDTFPPPPPTPVDDQPRVRLPPPDAPIESGPAILPPDMPTQPDTGEQTGAVSYSAAYGPPTIQSPHWLRRPRDLAHYYPERALLRGIEGRIELACEVDVQGALHCVVLSETPSGWHFGEAALRISRDYRMAPAMREGVAVTGRYRMVVPFEVS